MVDDYFDLFKKIKSAKNDFQELSNKFKELKSLVYDYKDAKENEILILGEDQSNLKKELESHRINYENLIDKATLEIESFIKKQGTDTQVQ